MTGVSYILLGRQSALSQELDSIANNIANSNTTGFRKDGLIFSEYVSALSGEPSISQARVGARTISAEQGNVIKTGASLDLAIEGEGYFAVITPAGQRLTRAGSFALNDEGLISTPSGHVMLGEGGAPIAVPQNSNEIVVSADGSVSADGAFIGRIELFAVPAASLSRDGDNLLSSNAELVPIERTRIRQGYLEGSNVDPVLELSRLIEVQRAFELEQQIVSDDADRAQRAIEYLSGAR